MPNRFERARQRMVPLGVILFIAACLTLAGAPLAVGQVPAAGSDAVQAPTAAELEKLVDTQKNA